MKFQLDQSLGFTTNRLANRLKAELEQGFVRRGHDITADQWLILSRLNEQDGLTQHELGERISKDKTNVARMLALMEEHGLVERRIDPDDNRARRIYLTAYSHALLPDLIAASQEVLARSQKGFTQEEVRQLIDTLNRVFHNLD
jgi:DNA-binding MarR family transcriptional regulator